MFNLPAEPWSPEDCENVETQINTALFGLEPITALELREIVQVQWTLRKYE